VSRKFFLLGYVSGLLMFTAVNIYSYQNADPPCCDRSIDFGLPFSLGTFGGYVGNTIFLPAGFVINSIIAVVTSLILGWLFGKLLPVLAEFITDVRDWHLSTRS
jgi:hypothetical protein